MMDCRTLPAHPRRGRIAQCRRPATTALLFALGTLVPQVGAASDTVAFWTFNQTWGPVIDDRARYTWMDPIEYRRSSGRVGYSSDVADDAEVDRDGSRATFNGQRDSIVLIDDDHHEDFNPGAKSLTVFARFVIDRSVMTTEALGPNQTWNLMQKGRYNNAGGQWKLQIRKDHAGRVFFQCLVNDDRPDTPKAAVQTALGHAWILNDHVLAARCTLDRRTDELSIDLTDTTWDVTPPRVATALPVGFGAVAPRAGECGTPEAFGGNVVIGNKPMCPNQQLDTDDAFRGTVHSIRLDRF